MGMDAGTACKARGLTRGCWSLLPSLNILLMPEILMRLSVTWPACGFLGRWAPDLGLVPMLDGRLHYDNCGGAPASIFADFQEAAALRGREDCQSPIGDHQHIHVGDGFEATVAACHNDGSEHAQGALIEHVLSISVED